MSLWVPSPEEGAGKSWYFGFERRDVVAEGAFLRHSSGHNQIHAAWQLCVHLAKRLAGETLDAVSLRRAANAGTHGEPQACAPTPIQVRMQDDPAEILADTAGIDPLKIRSGRDSHRSGEDSSCLGHRLASYASFRYSIGLPKGTSTMHDALKSDEIIAKVGGRFKFTALIQRRIAELIAGARPLVERNGRSDFEVVIEEIATDKITIDWERSNLPAEAR